jgi:sterol desaturase/sphingolipid hydroxylase (fatty acid hydroxylase superfamily)
MVESDTFRTVSMLLLGAGFLVLLTVESIRPLRDRRHPRAGRYLTNVVVTALSFLTGAVLVRPVGMGLALLSAENSFGILYLLELPGWVRFTAGFLLLDLTFYYWHRLNHSVHFLWRFHSVHHIDPDMDVTTSMRFHFVEVALSAIFRAVQVLAIGISPLTYVIYELVFSLATMFHHSNMNIPLEVEKRINRIFVTPRMHGVHHSVVRSELNSNYSVIFRWWDALNQSLVLNVPQSAITSGVGRFQSRGDNSILRLIALPFRTFPRERPSRTPRFGETGIRIMAE